MNRTEDTGKSESGWITAELSELPGVESVSYGVVRPGRHDPLGVPMVRAGDIIEGAVNDSDLARIAQSVDRQNRRTALRPEDLLVVLVGRIGDTAVAEPQHQGWNVARSVAIIRFTPDGLADGTSTWIRWWLGTSQARDRLRARSAGAEHATLPLADLKQLPVSLPPCHLRDRVVHTMKLAERKTALNTRIAARAIELADAYFSRFAHNDGKALRTGVPVADVCQVTSGIARVGADMGGEAIAWAAPREVLNSRTAHLDRTAEITWAPHGTACDPGTLLVAPRPGEVRTVEAVIPVIPGRGMLAIRTENETDRVWLLHELRSNAGELTAATQGEQARAMSRKKFSKFPLFWPAEGLREQFTRIASPLHARALAALKENHALQELVVSEMTDPSVARGEERAHAR
ncbi:hypothetical protein ABT104_14065 [Streptomyces mobaraensis]|uniref:hypothetical protein n=1 Tax=Streptomyces mobaraensis TaxID=35621 RepID=UPI00332F2B7B